MTQETKIKIGDTFAYQIENKDSEFNGRFLIFNKIKEKYWVNLKEKNSIYRVKITPDKKIPKTLEELNKLEYVKITMRVYEERYYPFMGSINGVELCRQKDKLKYYTDEFGYMYIYQFASIDSILDLPNLYYLGNYRLTKPSGEYVNFCKYDIKHLYSTNIEEYILKKYSWYNLKKSNIYTEEYSEKIRKDAKEVSDMNRDSKRDE